MRNVKSLGFLVAFALTDLLVWVHPAHAQDVDSKIFDLERTSIQCVDVIGRAHYVEEIERRLTVGEYPRPETDRFFSIIVKVDPETERNINQRFLNNETDSPAGFSLIHEGKSRITNQAKRVVAGRSATLTQSALSQVRPKRGFLFFVAPGTLTDSLRSEEGLCEPDVTRAADFEALNQHVEAQVRQIMNEFLRQRGGDPNR